MSAIHFTLQNTGRFQLLQHAMHGGFGKAGLAHEALQGEHRIFGSDDLQESEEPQRGGIAVNAADFMAYV